MTLLIELLLLFGIIFLAVRLGTGGHVDSHRSIDKPKQEIVQNDSNLVS